jgi:exodeoxyribonuclease VII small subunit
MFNQLKITGINKDKENEMTVAAAQDFATTLAELEKIVAELDSDIPIEKALELFERGMKLSTECEKFLNSAEQRIEILRKSMDNSIKTEPFDPPNSEDK